MKTSKYIKSLNDEKLILLSLVLSVYFDKNRKPYEHIENCDSFYNLHIQGRDELNNNGIDIPNELETEKIIKLIKIEMIKRGIESV